MDLVKRLKALAKIDGFSTSKIIWDEVDWFIRNHKGHGYYDLTIVLDEDGSLYGIDARCSGENVSQKRCAHQAAQIPELECSIFYNRDNPKAQLELQRKRRHRPRLV